MKPILAAGFVLLFWLMTAADARSQAPANPKSQTKKASNVPALEVTPENETEALAFVREHHQELAKVLEVLKPMDLVEYRKAIAELLQVSRNLADIKVRNPKRFEFALEAWKTKSRVELLAAQFTGSPSEELRSQLRTAIEAKVDAEIRRQHFELEQAEIAAKKARETLQRLEGNRDAVVEARLRALTPRKSAKSKKQTESPPAVAPTSKPSTNQPAQPKPGEDRR
jgi:hypothetical protein